MGFVIFGVDIGAGWTWPLSGSVSLCRTFLDQRQTGFFSAADFELGLPRESFWSQHPSGSTQRRKRPQIRSSDGVTRFLMITLIEATVAPGITSPSLPPTRGGCRCLTGVSLVICDGALLFSSICREFFWSPSHHL